MRYLDLKFEFEPNEWDGRVHVHSACRGVRSDQADAVHKIIHLIINFSRECSTQLPSHNEASEPDPANDPGDL